MGNSADALRRWLGAFCLAIAFGMLIWGETILKPFLTGLLFIFYWFTCFLFTCSSIVIALLDVRAVRRRVQAEQRDLIQRTLDEAENKTEASEQ
jgi:membrane protein implicated in regulation of membrane protease activity